MLRVILLAGEPTGVASPVNNSGAMDGFTDYATAVDQMLLKATKVMDPFSLFTWCIWPLRNSKPANCDCSRNYSGRRGRKDYLLYKYRKTLLTRCELLTPTQP
jgi:transposase